MAVRPAAPISGHSQQTRRKWANDLMVFDSGGLTGLLLVGSVGGIRIQPAEVGRAEGARNASMHDQYVASDSWRIRAIRARSAVSEAARPPARLDAQSGLQCPAAFERPIDRGTIALRPPQTGCAARYFFGQESPVITTSSATTRLNPDIDNRAWPPDTLAAREAMPPSSRGLGHRLFMPATGVRIPLGVVFHPLIPYRRLRDFSAPMPPYPPFPG